MVSLPRLRAAVLSAAVTALVFIPRLVGGQIVPTDKGTQTEQFGGGDLFAPVMRDLGPVCEILRTFVLITASIGLVWSFWNMFRAARSGGLSGNWRLALVLFFVSGAFVRPRQLLELLGLEELLAGTATLPLFQCILGS